LRQAYDYWQDQPGLYITTAPTHRRFATEAAKRQPPAQRLFRGVLHTPAGVSDTFVTAERLPFDAGGRRQPALPQKHQLSQAPVQIMHP